LAHAHAASIASPLAFTFLGSSFAADEPFKIIHVDDLAKLMAGQRQTLSVYDANPPSTREREASSRRPSALLVRILRRR